MRDLPPCTASSSPIITTTPSPALKNSQSTSTYHLNLKSIEQSPALYQQKLQPHSPQDFRSLSPSTTSSNLHPPPVSPNRKSTTPPPPTMSSIFQFVKEGSKEDVTKLLKENSPRELVALKDVYEQTPLHIACFEGHTDIVSVLIKKGAKIDQKDKNGWTPLHCAASSGHFKACEYLIQKDPQLAKDPANDGSTPFHYLVRRWDPVLSPKILGIIVKNDPSIVNLSANNMETPLHHACLKNCEESIVFLLNHKADVNKRSKNGETCLSFAIRAGYKNVVKMLLEYGVDEQAYDAAFQIATAQSMEDVRTMVEQCQQYMKVRPDNEKPYKKGYLTKFGGKIKGWKKTWIVLDGLRIRQYNSDLDIDTCLGEIVLKDIESIGIEETNPNYQFCLSIGLKDNPTKVLLAAEDRITMAKWALAIDGLKFKFFDSCINQFVKYGSHCLGWGKFNGFILEWMLGELGERGVKLHEYHWEEMEREYLTNDTTMAWKWTRHFLTLKHGAGEWIVEGEVPEPVVFFLCLLRYSRLANAANENSTTQ
eukprot:gene3668-4222_t